MEKRWKYNNNFDPNVAERLSDELGINLTLATLLAQRGIKTYDEAKRFFRPSLDYLYDPFQMTDMHNAVERINVAIRRGEKILFYGDYDVDGTTAVALMHSFFRKRYPQKTWYYIPDRYNEGYGISHKGIDYAAQNGYSLIVALDCGIKAIEKINYAKQYKIDFIICDHHLPGEQIPEAIAVLDPKRTDCHYPFKELSGCGVGFKLLQAYCKDNGITMDELYGYLDLLAVSIASDIVPIIDENRVMAHFGLERLNTSPSRGLKAIIKTAGIDKQHIGIDDIVFRIGPRINAAGRMESGQTAVDLLCAENESQANEICTLIDSCNNDRKNIDRTITHEAIRMIADDVRLQRRNSTVLFNPNWHKGVVGIVASRLIETYFRPTIVLTQSGNFATGSARSVPGYDLYQAIENCSDLLENFGGHTYAAGLTMKVENVEKFRARFEEHVSQTIDPAMLTPQIDVDAKINIADVDDKFFRILKQFQPFGPGNMAPVFESDNVVDNGKSNLVGNDKEHLKLSITQSNGSTVYSAIAFQLAEHYRKIHKGIPFNICYTLYENVFRGVTSMQLRVKDIKFDAIVVASINTLVAGLAGDLYTCDIKCEYHHEKCDYVNSTTDRCAFNSPDGLFEASFPGAIQNVELRTKEECLKLKLSVISCVPQNNNDNLSFSISYIDYPTQFLSENMNEAELTNFYKNTLKGTLLSLNAEPISNSAISINGLKAQKAKARINEGKSFIETINLAVKNRLYMLTAITSGQGNSMETADNFFKSFKLKEI